MSPHAKQLSHLQHHSDSWRVICLAASSRALALALLVCCGQLGLPYDTSSQLLSEDDGYGGSSTSAVAWDAVFYQRIAEAGYEYEQFHAFFPLLPLMARLLQHTVFTGWHPVSSFQAAAVLISWASFVISAWFLSRITDKVFSSSPLSSAAVLFYCFNPASVFHAAAYTESLFGALTFMGVYGVYCQRNYLLAALSFSLSSAVRSNGVVNAGFILHACGQEVIRAATAKNWAHTVISITQAIASVAVVFAPLIGFQYFGFLQYCSNPAYTAHPRPWCSSSLPYLYGFVQKQYWNVGFLKYFTLQQAPNFLLAAPILLLSFHGISAFASKNVGTMMSLGLSEPPLHDGEQGTGMTGLKGASKESTAEATPSTRQRRFDRRSVTSDPSWLPSRASVFIFHWAFLALVAFLVMHVQVATRFLSCSPAVYWYMAHLWVKKQQRWLWFYCFTYMALGSLLFANFLPWT